ncbi:MAG TPA: tetratricopeptide repeat protein [Polyangiaceae bacterium]|nr:tetratricopeptide repeat protein [Polyangiaceae bacterium]
MSLRGVLLTGIISLSSAFAMAADSKASFPACTTAPTEADRKAAQGAFAAGQGSFNEADYATAITYWRDAYRRDCTAHALLLNLARAYELKGDRPEAVTSLETYLQRKPDASDADQIKRRIENLKTQIASSPAPAATVTPVAPPTSTSPGPALPPPSPPPNENVEKGKSRSILPLIVAGAGGLVAILGVSSISQGKTKENEANEACKSRMNCLQSVTDKGNEGIKQQTTGGILLGVGGVAIAGGLVWYFVQSPSGGSAHAGIPLGKRAQVTPSVLPGYAGVSLGGSF